MATSSIQDRHSWRKILLMLNMEPIFKIRSKISQMEHLATKITLTSLFSLIQIPPLTVTLKLISNHLHQDSSICSHQMLTREFQEKCILGQIDSLITQQEVYNHVCSSSTACKILILSIFRRIGKQNGSISCSKATALFMTDIWVVHHLIRTLSLTFKATYNKISAIGTIIRLIKAYWASVLDRFSVDRQITGSQIK